MKLSPKSALCLQDHQPNSHQNQTIKTLKNVKLSSKQALGLQAHPKSHQDHNIKALPGRLKTMKLSHKSALCLQDHQNSHQHQTIKALKNVKLSSKQAFGLQEHPKSHQDHNIKAPQTAENRETVVTCLLQKSNALKTSRAFRSLLMGDILGPCGKLLRDSLGQLSVFGHRPCKA